MCSAWRQVCLDLLAPIQLTFGWVTTRPAHAPTTTVTDAGLGATFGRSNFCNQIRDPALARIGEGCPNLKSLDLRGCSKITDVGLATIGAGCPNLKSLDLGGCNRITDAGLASIGEGCGISR